MAVYKGVLREMSGGRDVVVNTQDGYRDTGLTRREFIDVGDRRLRNVVLSHYHDALLVSAMGQDIELSVVPPLGISRQNRVLAVRRPNGMVEKGGFMGTLFQLIYMVLLSWILAAIVGGILFFMGSATHLTPVVWLAVGLAIYIVAWYLVSAFRTFRAWAAF